MLHKFKRMFLPEMSIVFENDPDPTNVDDSKPSAGGGSDSGDDSKKTEPKDQTYDLIVDGEKRTVTIDEMRELAQKSAGADKKFQSASEMRKEAEKGLRISTLVKSLSEKPSDDEAKELAALLGIEPNEFLQYLNEGTGDDTPVRTKKATGGGKTSKDDVVAALKELGLDPVEVKSVLDYSHQRHIDSAKQEIRKISDEAVDKDEIFGKMIVGEKAEDRLAVLKDMVAEDVLRRIQDGIPFGTELVAASVQKVRSHLTKFGIPGKPDQHPIVMGLGPGGGLPAEVQTEEPIARINAAEDDGEKNLIARYLQKGLRKIRESGK